MKFRTACLTALSVAALALSAATPVSAAGSPRADNPPAKDCIPSIAQKTGGYYDEAPEKGLGFWFFMMSGTGTLPFSAEFAAEMKRADVRIEAVCPVGMLKGGKGFWTPVGSDGYSNMNFLNGRIWYPGGWKFTNNKTGRSFLIDGFWLHDLPFISKASGNGYVDGSKKPVETEMATYDTFDVFAQLPTPGLGGLGPKDWRYYLTDSWAKQLNTVLGTKFKRGDHALSLEINAWPLPGVHAPLKEGYEAVARP